MKKILILALVLVATSARAGKDADEIGQGPEAAALRGIIAQAQAAQSAAAENARKKAASPNSVSTRIGDCWVLARKSGMLASLPFGSAAEVPVVLCVESVSIEREDYFSAPKARVTLSYGDDKPFDSSGHELTDNGYEGYGLPEGARSVHFEVLSRQSPAAAERKSSARVWLTMVVDKKSGRVDRDSVKLGAIASLEGEDAADELAYLRLARDAKTMD